MILTHPLWKPYRLNLQPDLVTIEEWKESFEKQTDLSKEKVSKGFDWYQVPKYFTGLKAAMIYVLKLKVWGMEGEVPYGDYLKLVAEYTSTFKIEVRKREVSKWVEKALDKKYEADVV